MIDPCKDEALLSALLDGELPPARAEAIRRHIEECPLCRERYESLQQADQMIRALPEMKPSADFDRNFWRRVTAMEERRASRSWSHYLLSGWRPLVASGLAAGVAVAVFLHSGHDKRVTPDELFMAEHIDLLENYEVIDRLDLLENWDLVENLKEPS